jgi:3alpha(or 20beta)-hydroxysteroid dehydrogenase
MFLRLDVTDPDGWARLAEQLRREHGRVDGLVNNAARLSLLRLLDVGVEEFEATLRVNLTSALMGIQAVVPLMQGGGSIVNVCAVAALNAHFTTAYTASKWALRGLSRVASLELGPRAIRVNAIFPGLVDTPMVRSAPPVIREVQLEDIPLGRAAQPEDVAPAIVFLISDESAWITGAELAIDGGASAHGGSKRISDRMRSFSQANQFTAT